MPFLSSFPVALYHFVSVSMCLPLSRSTIPVCCDVHCVINHITTNFINTALCLVDANQRRAKTIVACAVAKSPYTLDHGVLGSAPSIALLIRLLFRLPPQKLLNKLVLLPMELYHHHFTVFFPHPKECKSHFYPTTLKGIRHPPMWCKRHL